MKFRNILSELPGFSGYSLYGVLRNPVDAILLSPLREIKYFWQRGRRGYSDRDAWSIDWYLSSWMPAAIRSLKGGGCPSVLLSSLEPTEEEVNAAHEKWHEILNKIALGFESHLILDGDIPPPGQYRDELEAREKEGLALFAEYFPALWD